MNAYVKAVALIAAALFFPAPAAFAQERPAYAPERPANTQARPAFRQEQLDQILAPIALHPDALLSQILMASTYPLEVVQAARWSKANPGITGSDAVKAVERMNWDPSVKSLTAFPDILAMMDERLEWTEQLGEAFLAQQAQVMDTIQGLRRRAEGAGNLRPDERMAVTRRDDYIMIEPADPQVVHVPSYNPRVAYGPWWAPDYPPVYWGPPPGYYYGGPAYWGPGFLWGPGIAIVPGFFFGAFAWPYHHVTVVYSSFYHGYYMRRGIVWARPGPVAWRHDTFHRRSVPYQQATLRQQYAPSRVQRLEGGRGVAGPGAAPRAPTSQPPQGDRSRRSGASPERQLERPGDPAARSFRQDARTVAPNTGAPQRSTNPDRAPGVERPRDTGRRDASGFDENARRVQPGAASRSEFDRQQFRPQRSGSRDSTMPAQRGGNREPRPATDRRERQRATSMVAGSS